MSESVETFVSRRMVERREQLGQPQAAVARAAGIDRPALNKLEHGGTRLTVEKLCKLALALGVEPAHLLPTLEQLRGMIGMGVDPLPKLEVPTGQAYVDAVIAGARSYLAKHRKRPRVHDGDAIEHVGFAASWSSIDSTLRKGSNGVTPCGGLHGLLDRHGVGQRRYATPRPASAGAGAASSRSPARSASQLRASERRPGSR